MIRRMTVLPLEGKEALQVLLSDGTGEVVAVFMGRRGIGGLSLGKRVVVEGSSASSGETSGWSILGWSSPASPDSRRPRGRRARRRPSPPRRR